MRIEWAQPLAWRVPFTHLFRPCPRLFSPPVRIKTRKALLFLRGLVAVLMSNVVLIVPVMLVLMIVVVMVTVHNNLAAHTSRLATKGIVDGHSSKGSTTSDNTEAGQWCAHGNNLSS